VSLRWIEWDTASTNHYSSSSLERTSAMSSLFPIVRLTRLLYFTLLIASTAGILQAQVDGWEIIGPGGGGSHFKCTVNPFDTNNVFSRCDMTGAQVSWDGGENWHHFNLRTVINDFEFDPSDENTVYASSTGLFRSENKGRTWKLIYPAPGDIIEERMVGDHAEHSIITRDGLPGGWIDKVHVDPQNHNHIVIAVLPTLTPRGGMVPLLAGDQIKIMATHDRGKSWKVVAHVPGQAVLAIFPGSWEGRPDEILVVTDRAGAVVSERDGSVQMLDMPVSSLHCADGGKGADGSVIYLLSRMNKGEYDKVQGGLFRSRDLGRSWTQINSGLLKDYHITAQVPYFKAVAVCENYPETAYLSAHVYNDEILVPSSKLRTTMDRKFGTFKTENAGDSWRWVYRASMDSLYTHELEGGWENESFGPEWGESPHSFGVSPANPDICYVTDNRTFVTRDGGKSWQQIYSNRHPDGSWSTRGINVTTTYGVHFDPFDKDHMIISYTDIGCWNSFNGGKSWFHAINGVPRQWINTTYWTEFDPDVRDKIFTVRSNCHDLPRPKMFRNGKIERHEYQGGVAVSADGGRTWTASTSGMSPNAVCTHLVLDPQSPPANRTLYVTATGQGVYKSSDDGRSWTLSNQGLGDRPNAWRFARRPDNGALFLITMRALRDKAEFDGGLFRSDDGAASWQKVALPEGVNGPHDLQIDPEEPDRMYLSAWPWTRLGKEYCGGLYRTEDGGVSWTRVFNQQAHVWGVAIDPRKPSTIYINTFDNAAFRSDNRGESWTRIPGYNFKWGHRPIIDPYDPEMIYLTTFGGSVFHGPAKGKPVIEDIENFPPKKW
jgi:hypothetical protein